MKFLITGIGSIGQRHFRNLTQLGHEVALLRSGRPNSDHIQAFIDEQVTAGHTVTEYTDLETALSEFDPTGVLITNPNASHMEIALPVARAGKHLLIEKPLSNSMEGLDDLSQLAQKNNLKIQIGYNLRWHPHLIQMKQLMEQGRIGRVLSAHVEMGENQADWHPWEDHLDTYGPYKECGGGVVLCFSHDIDYLYWFFGMPKTVYTVGGQMTSIGGDAEDMVKSLFSYENGMIASVHLDYWQRPKRRTFNIVGTEGRMDWDYDNGTLTIESREPGMTPEILKIGADFDRNDTFINEVKDFIAAIENKSENLIPLQDGIEVLQLCNMIKKPIKY